jgi:Leucine-rich repeat (LRR) protein
MDPVSGALIGLAIQQVQPGLDHLRRDLLAVIDGGFVSRKRCKEMEDALASETFQRCVCLLFELGNLSSALWPEYQRISACLERAHCLLAEARRHVNLQSVGGRDLTSAWGVSWKRGLAKELHDLGLEFKKFNIDYEQNMRGWEDRLLRQQEAVTHHSHMLARAQAESVALRQPRGPVRCPSLREPVPVEQFVQEESSFKTLLQQVAENRRVGVVGMGGIGKTVLVSQVFKKLKEEGSYDHTLFMTVSESPKLDDLLKGAVHKLFKVSVPDHGYEAMAYLKSKFSEPAHHRQDDEGESLSILLVLDDVWEKEHFDALDFATHTGGHCCSSLIVTTRNRAVIEQAPGILRNEMAEVKMKLLDEEAARKLILRHALSRSQATSLPASISNDLVQEVTKECGGLPLCLVLIGSAICAEGADLPASWENFRDKLRVLPSHGFDQTSLKRCKLSYDVLSPALRQCMREWAAFPEDERLSVHFIVSVWSAFLPLLPSSTDALQYGRHQLKELQSRSLVFHDEINEECYVHDIVWSMMKEECEGLSKTVGEGRIRWERRVLFMPGGSFEKVTAICTDNKRFSRREHLLQSIGYSSQAGREGKLNSLYRLSLARGSCPCLQWGPAIESLRALYLPQCGLKDFPEQIAQCTLLRVLDMSSNRFASLPGCISKLIALTVLNMSDCDDLQRLPEEVWYLRNLQALFLRRCRSLCSLELSGMIPLEGRNGDFHGSISLQLMDLSWCCGLCKLPHDLSRLIHLTWLNLNACMSLESLPAGIGQLNQLQSLNIGWCRRLKHLPEDICSLSKLTELNLDNTSALKGLPVGIGQLTQLQSLNLEMCTGLRDLPQSMSSLVHLTELNLTAGR